MAGVPRIRQTSGARIPYGGPGSPADWYVQDFSYDALLVSQPHFRLPNGAWSGGGPFFTEHVSVKHSGRAELKSFIFYGQEFGPVRFAGVGDPIVYRPPVDGGGGHSVPVTSKEVARDRLVALQGDNYARGIIRTRPGRAEAGVGQFLAELKDLPSLPGKAFVKALPEAGGLRHLPRYFLSRIPEFFNASASELLNWDFGWRPLVKDLRDFRKLSKGLNDRLAKLVRENGKPLRRGAKLGSTTTVERLADLTIPGPMWHVGGGPSNANGRSHVTRTRVTREERWFVAGYRYWIADTSSWLWKGKAAAALYGVLPTPELLWNITPWSWLIDWYGELGDIVSFWSPTAVDNLVTLWAFTMRHRVVEDMWEATTHLERNDFAPNGVPYHVWDEIGQTTFRSIYKVESKERGSGWAPFGSGLPSSPLSGRQQAILAALGISRAYRAP